MGTNDPLLRALAKVCQEHPTRRKVLLLGNPAHGAAVLERLTRSGVNWANLAVRSAVGYAAELCAGILESTPIPPGAGPAVAAMLLAEDIPAESRLRAVGSSQGAAAAVWRTISDLRMAGLQSKDLDAKHFVDTKRAKEVRDLLAAYEKHLAKNDWYDESDLLKAGAEAVKKAKDLILVPKPCRWSAREAAFIKAAGCAVVEVPVRREGGLEVMSAKASVLRAVSQEAEAREIGRRILEAKVPLDEVEIALAGPEYDRAVLVEFLEKAEIPFTLSQGYPLGAIRPGKALLGYLAWVESGFEAGALEKLLRAGVLTLKRVDENASGLAAARALARFSGYKGRAAYDKVFRAQEAHLEESAKEHEREGELEQAEAARKRLAILKSVGQAVADIVRSADWADSEDKILLSKAVEGCCAFMHTYAATRNPLEVAALAVLCDALAVPVLAGDRAMNRMEACRLLRETALTVSLGAERARPGKVHVTSLADAGWEGRPFAFVAGLTLTNHPGRTFQDPFLLDEERQSLGSGLATAEELALERARDIDGSLASLQGRAAFSAYVFDGGEGREVGPAALFLKVARKALNKPEAGYKDLDDIVGKPVSLPPEDKALPMDELSWWLAAEAGAKDGEKAFPWLKDAAEAARARRGAELTIHEGLVPSAAGALDPTMKDAAVSATYMADLAACPFRFFLKRVLEVDPKEEEERDPLVWLDALERGSLLHEVYADFLRGLKGRAPDLGKDEDALLGLLDKKLEDLRGLIPPATEALFAGEKDELKRDALLFLRKTAEEWPGRKPIGFEVAFGMRDDSGEKLSHSKPVAASFGGESFNIRGRVDRVDKTADGYEIVDYKTGRLTDNKREEMGRLPAAFQPAFYSKAVEVLLKADDPKAKVKAFAFLFSTRAGRWSMLRMGPDAVEKISQEIPRLLKLLKKGIFHQTMEEEECRYCPFSAACGEEPWKRAQVLLGVEAA